MISKKLIKVFVFLSLIGLLFSPLLKKKGGYHRMEVLIAQNKDPRVPVEIEGKSYLFSLDTGGGFCFTMQQDLLNRIHKKESLGTNSGLDVKGNPYELPIYKVDAVKVGRTNVSDAPVKEESIDFLLNGSQLNVLHVDAKERLAPKGRIGAPFFRLGKHWLFDFPHSSLVVMKNRKIVKTLPGFSLKGFTEIDLENIQPHIVISADTDLGRKRFLLDTGSTHSLLRISSEFPTKKNLDKITLNRLEIAHAHFGPRSFTLYEITSKLDFFDGILGMDFFLEHQILIDFEENKAYIGPPLT